MVRKGMTIFWTLYMLFFAIPFPMILYYTITYSGGSHEATLSAPTAALAYLGLSVMLWGMQLSRWFKSWVMSVYHTKRNMLSLLRDGVPKVSTIVKSNKTGKQTRGYDEYEFVISFENFAGERIMEKLQFTDSKPHERRFEEGKTLPIRIDKQMEKQPFVVPEGITVSIRQTQRLMGLIAWLLVALAVVWYYYFSYQLEHNGTGWRFLVFWHPLVLCPLILLGYQVLFVGVLGRLFGLSGGDIYLKYHGQRTTARVVNAVQTGTYINNQPQVKFDLAYQDQTGRNHEVSLKKIVSLLNMNATQQGEVEIFYLPDNPKQVAFAADFDVT